MEYSHTQYGRFHYVLYAVIVLMLVAAGGDVGGQAPALALFTVGGLILVVAQSFQYLTITDEGDALALRYGPLPLFSKRITYSSIQSVEVDRTRWIDGWGIHWLPSRGSTYNIWGYDCVKLLVSGRIIRIGTDDPDNLAVFLRWKVATHSGGGALA